MSKILSEEEVRMLLLPSECESIEKQLSKHGNNIRLRNSTCMKLLFTISELRKENAELKAKKIDWEKIYDKVLFNYKDRELNTEFYGCYELVKREVQEQLIYSNNK